MALHPGTDHSNPLLGADFSSQEALLNKEPSGVDQFSELRSADINISPGAEAPGFDPGKVNFATKVGASEPVDTPFRAGTSQAEIDRAAKEQAAQLSAGVRAGAAVLESISDIANIKANERVAMTRLSNQMADFEFTKRLRADDAEMTRAMTALNSLDQLEQQAGVQTAGSQSQQFFRSPTTGRTL